MRILLILCLSFILFLGFAESIPLTSSTALPKTAILTTILTANGKNVTTNRTTVTTVTKAETIPVKKPSNSQPSASIPAINTTTTIITPTILKQNVSSTMNFLEILPAEIVAVDSFNSTYPSSMYLPAKKHYSKAKKIFFIAFVCTLLVLFILCIIYLIIMYGIKGNGAYMDQYG